MKNSPCFIECNDTTESFRLASEELAASTPPSLLITHAYVLKLSSSDLSIATNASRNLSTTPYLSDSVPYYRASYGTARRLLTDPLMKYHFPFERFCNVIFQEPEMYGPNMLENIFSNLPPMNTSLVMTRPTSVQYNYLFHLVTGASFPRLQDNSIGEVQDKAEQNPEWYKKAKCAISAKPSEETTGMAENKLSRTICTSCLVIDDCLKEGLKSTRRGRYDYSLWGGLSLYQRKKVIAAIDEKDESRAAYLVERARNNLKTRG